MKRKRKIRKLAAEFLVLAAVLVLSGCTLRSAPKLNKYEAQYMDYFDTVTSVTFYLENESQFKEVDQLVRSEFERYHQLYDIYNNYKGINNIKTINDNAGIIPVTVDADIIRLLQFAIGQYEVTGGKMNIAMGSVLSIWHEYREAGMKNRDGYQIPDLEQLMRADQYTDIHLIRIDEAKSAVYLADPNMKLDVGAVAKGYAVQRICESLTRAGVTSGLISAGGNVRTIGQKGDGTPWRVGVQNPDIYAEKGYLHALNLEDMALVTSGSYQRYFEVNGVRYHHIINPDTLMPWNEYVSVTILCRDSGIADALSTALFNMTPEAGMALIQEMEETEAMWVYPDGKEVYSPGFQNYIDD